MLTPGPSARGCAAPLQGSLSTKASARCALPSDRTLSHNKPLFFIQPTGIGYFVMVTTQANTENWH